MSIVTVQAAEFQDDYGPDGRAARACVALARAETQLDFSLSPRLQPGKYCFSLYVRARRAPCEVSLVLGDQAGVSHQTAAVSERWQRLQVAHTSRTETLFATLSLGAPGTPVPILTDVRFAMPQVELGAFASSPISPEPPTKPWAIYDSLDDALRARDAADAVGGFPQAAGSTVTLSAAVTLCHPSGAGFAMPATAFLREAVRRGHAKMPTISALDAGWRYAVPLPLTAEAQADAFRAAHSSAFSIPCLIGPDGIPLRDDATQVVAVRHSLRELVEALDARPEDLPALHWRKFEELIAHLLERDGFEAKLTPHSGDHGIDVLAIKKAGLGQFVVGVQCKRHGASNKVGGNLIRELLGALQDQRLDRGVLVTTSTFQPQAEEIAARHPLRLSLVDHLALVQWLALYR